MPKMERAESDVVLLFLTNIRIRIYQVLISKHMKASCIL